MNYGQRQAKLVGSNGSNFEANCCGTGGQGWDNSQPPIWNTVGECQGTVKICFGSEIGSVDFNLFHEGAFPCDWGPLWVLFGMVMLSHVGQTKKKKSI